MARRKQMAEKLEAVQNAPEIHEIQEVKVQRPKRAKLMAEEVLKRMEAFSERKGQIVAAVRKSKSGGVSS
jgi:hypothetical protein